MPIRPRSRGARPWRWIPALLAAALGYAQAGIVLTEAPAGMRKQTAEITLGWTGGQGRVHLRASTVPGGAGAAISHYDSLHLPSRPDAGSFTFKVNPDIPAQYRNTDLRFGINYCILTDGTQASPEFIIIIESGNAPVLASPANAASIKDLTPTFAWTGDAPYYALLVSDEPFKISDDGTVSGVSAIWQIITPYTSVRYGDADPSGFNTVPAPPLISGKTYNWLVLNNYGNNSASTSKVAPVPASFVYSPSAPLPAAQLLEPADRDTVPGTDQILFRWAQVDGAVSYKLELLEENRVDGSQADVALWKASSTGGRILLDDAGGILRRYNYKWRVYALGSNGSASLSEKRSFFYAAAVGEIALTVKNQAGQKLAYVPVKLNRLGGASSGVFQGGSTDNDGALSIKNAPLGGYEARIENFDGYQNKVDTIQLTASGTGSKTLVLTPVLGKILGKAVSSATGTGLLNAKITLTGPEGDVWSVTTNSQGNYSVGVPFGNWQVHAEAEGYAAPADMSVSLNAKAVSKNADFALVPNKFTLSGIAQNSFSRQGIFGATVTLTQAGVTRTLGTDGSGGFSFSVPGGALVLRVSSAGFASPEPTALEVDGDRSLVLALDPNASILSGRTRDASGTALRNATVLATPKAGPVRSALSNAVGGFELSLPAGDWSLNAAAAGYSPGAARKFLLDASKTVQGVDFSLDANASFIKGRVTVNGSGLAGARITAADAAALSDNSGYYLLSVKAGSHSVAAAKDGFLIPKIYSVPVNAGDTVAGVDFPASGNAGVVKGRVLAGGAGVVGASVQALNQATREAFQRITDGQGAYSISLPGGEYQVSAAREGYALDQTVSFSLPAGGTLLDADLRLVSDQGGITGTTASGDASLGGCEVAYRNAASPALAGKTVTDPQGRFSLSLQSGAAYALTATCPGYQIASSLSAVLVRGGALIQDFNLAKAGASIRGKVTDQAGAALAGVKVTAEKNGDAVAAVSDFNGGYSFALGAGTYALSLSKPGYRTLSRSLSLGLGENPAAEDALAATIGRIAGRVTCEGLPVAGALISLTGQSPEAGGGTFATDADGRFAGEGVPAGNYGLTASAEGYSDGKIASLTVAAGGLANAEIALLASRGSLTGTVKAGGSPLADVTVVANAYGVSRSAASAADGSYRIDKLPSGIYSVSAVQAGYSPEQAYAGQSLPAAGSLTGLDFSLSRNAGSLSGTVSGSEAMAGIRISALGKKGARGYAACDASGKYSIPSLPADTYALTISAPGYKLSGSSQNPEVAVTGAAVYNPSLVAARFRLSGKILNQAAAGIPGIPVELRIAQDKLKTVSGSDGAYAFADVPAGQEYQLACRPPTADYDARDTVFSLDLAAPAQVSADLSTLARTASLAGTVLVDGVPAEGATLRVSGNGNDLAAVSQPNGIFKVTGVAGASRSLSFSIAKPGAGSLDTALTVGVGEAVTRLSVKLKTVKVALTVTLANSEGKPLSGARLAVVSGKKPDTLTAAADGKVSLRNIPANQSLTLATLLDPAGYDNTETAIFLKEKDTAVALEAKIHASAATVQVQDGSGTAVDGADVLVNGKRMGTTVQGKYRVTGLGRGEYRFGSGKAAYKSGSDQVLALSGDTTVAVTLTLAQVEGGVYGTVGDSGPGAGRSLPGAVVAAYAGSDTLKDTANSLGQYFLEGMVEGRNYAVTLTLPGYKPLVDSIIATAAARNLDLRLSPVAGSVLGRAENGHAGVRILLSHAASGRISASATGPGGYYAFTGLQNRDDYSLQAIENGLSSPAFPFQADAASAKRIDPILEAWGGLEGTVSGGASASPIGGALVSARNSLTGSPTWTLTDSAGRYSIAGLAAGTYEAAVESKGYRSPPKISLAVTRGSAAAKADFALEETEAGISGRVTDAAGQAVNAAVWLAKGADTLRLAADGAGRFLFAGLAAGTYSLSASQPGYAAPPAVDIAYTGKGLALRNLSLGRRGHLIHGRVRDALTNTPVSGATVRLRSATAITSLSDSAGNYELAIASASPSPVDLEAFLDGYLAQTGFPVYLDAGGSGEGDIALTADYKFDGEIAVTVREGKEPVGGLLVSVQSFHPDDSLGFSVTGQAPSVFRDLRRPAPYTIKVKRDGFKDLAKVVELTAKAPKLDIALAYPTSRIRVFVTGDGKAGKGVDLSLNGLKLTEDADTAGLYASAAKLAPGSYEVAIKDRETGLIPLAPYFIALGEDSARTDTLSQPFFQIPIADTLLGAGIPVQVRRTDSLRPAPAAVCSLYYRPQGEPAWLAAILDSTAGGFAGALPPQTKAGAFEYYPVLRSPSGARIGTVTPAGSSGSTAPLAYTGIQSPGKFTLRDPYLLNSIALSPQRLEADTSVYSLRARDGFEARLRGEKGRDLDAYFDARRNAADTGFAVSWSFGDSARARAFGLSLQPDSATPRICRFRGGALPSDSVFSVLCQARMGAVRLRKSFFIKIQDLAPASIAIRYVKENRTLEDGGAVVSLSNRNPPGYAFSAFARTADGREFNISPRWSFGADSAVGTISQQGLFIPDSNVARSAVLHVTDTLQVAVGNNGETLYHAFSFAANLATLAQVAPAPQGRTLVTDGEGAFLDFNLAGLSKAFTVTVSKPKVSGLLRASPREEVVGEILDIDLSERQPFKADSGATLMLQVAKGIAQRRTVFLGHWNSSRLAWEKVDSAKGDTAVAGKVYSFSKYAVIMGSLPLGAYDFIATPNPFSSEDPWGLQLGYKVSSDVSSQVGVRVEVYDMMGDKVYESQEVQLSKGQSVQPGSKKAAVNSSGRKAELGPFVWDGHDNRGVACRNGRYLLKLIVRDGQGRKEYLKKVVMLK